MDDWAAKIKALEEAGWSLTKLGEAIELSPQALSDIKQGRTMASTAMSYVRLHELYVALGKKAA